MLRRRHGRASVAHRLLSFPVVIADEPVAIRSQEDPRQAFRLLRHLRLAEVLWGRETPLPIAALDASDGVPRMRVLRILLQLEREGAVVLQRVTRAVQLVDPPDQTTRAANSPFSHGQ